MSEHNDVVVCSRVAAEAEAATADMVDELDELRRSFSARLRSESLQRHCDNLEKDTKIQRLQTLLESQLRRERDKDQRIGELEIKVDAVMRRRDQSRDEIKGQPPTANVLPSQTEDDRFDGGKTQTDVDSTSDDPCPKLTADSGFNDLDVPKLSEELQENDNGADTSRQRQPAKRTGCNGAFLCLSKQKSSQPKVAA